MQRVRPPDAFAPRDLLTIYSWIVSAVSNVMLAVKVWLILGLSNVRINNGKIYHLQIKLQLIKQGLAISEVKTPHLF